jgi:non-canonical purine NTP pyrophosphatase (RdgB/HAM1 family)
MNYPQKIYFATSSDVKYKQYSYIFNDYGVKLTRATVISSISVEPQADQNDTMNEFRIVAHPLRLAARFAAKTKNLPYMVEDTTLFINEFSKVPTSSFGLPGADTKNWWLNFGAEGILDLLKNKKNREARFTCQIGMYTGGSSYFFEQANLFGVISYEIKTSQIAYDDFPRSNPYFFHSIFIPNNSLKTLAEMSGEEFMNYDYRRICVKNMFTKFDNKIIKWPIDHQIPLFE